MSEQRITLDGDDCDYLVWRKGSGDTVEILDVAIGSERRVGKGRRLLRLLFAQVPEASLVWALTRATNQIAHQWYVACGFHEVGVLYGFYDASQPMRLDAVMFGRTPKGGV